MHLHIAKILAGAIAHLRLNVSVQRLPAAALMVDPIGGAIVEIERTIAAALRQQTLDRAVANLLLKRGQRRRVSTRRVSFLFVSFSFRFVDDIFLFFG
jgi:hypothetical protein